MLQNFNKKFIVHAWEVHGYARVDKTLRDLIRSGLGRKYGALYKAEKLLGFSEYHHRLLHKKFTRVDILFDLVRYAGISPNKAEKHIFEWAEGRFMKYRYPIKFPAIITPFHIRTVSHVIGDGHDYKIEDHKTFVWTQNNTEPLRNLQEIILNRNLKYRSNSIGIRKIIVKQVCAFLRVNVDEFDEIEFLNRCLVLPKDFRLQVITAVIEDEGSVDKNRITIRMKNKPIVELITKFIDSLGYQRSDIKPYEDKNKWSNGKIKMYRISILTMGIRKYYKDLEEIKKNYGDILGLWTKRKKLAEAVSRPMRIIGDIRNRKFANILLKRKEYKFIIPKNLVTKLNLKPNQVYSLLRFMLNKGYIEKIRRGVYQMVIS